MCHHWAKKHRRIGGPAWFCYCGSSVCSSSCGWDRTGFSACDRGSGPADDLPPPPQAPTPPPVSLQLQPRVDRPTPVGSAGQAALARQSMGAGAAVSHCGDTPEHPINIYAPHEVCGLVHKIVNIKMSHLLEQQIHKVISSHQESDEVGGVSVKRQSTAILLLFMSMWHHFRGMPQTPKENIHICLDRNWWIVTTVGRNDSDQVIPERAYFSHSHEKQKQERL